MELREQVRSFIISNFLVADPAALLDHMSLLDRGIVDSTGMLEIIYFIEETYGFKIDFSEMSPENLDSIERISYFVARKLA